MKNKMFDEIFGITRDLNAERQAFINRIESTLFNYLDSLDSLKEYGIVTIVLYGLGEKRQDFTLDFRRETTFSVIARNDFYRVLKILVLLYEVYKNKNHEVANIINERIKWAINASIGLDVTWKDGMFYPAGEKILDEGLINESLDCLIPYPDEYKDIANALEEYSKKNYAGVISNCFNAAEGISKVLLKSDTGFHKLKKDLGEKLGLTHNWINIINSYNEYANKYRHASKERHSPDPDEVESFLYLTCLVIRLITKKM